MRVSLIIGLFFILCLGQGLCVHASEPAFEKDGGVYLIQSAEDMRTLAELVNRGEEEEPGVAAQNASYRLTCDIDLTAYCTGEGGWEPIGYRNYNDDGMHDGYFNGSFDGENHVVTGLFIDRPDEQGQGLFGTRVDLRGGDRDSGEYKSRETTVIKNLYIEDCDITGASNTGGIMGGMWNFLQYEGGDLFIENCHVTGKITGYTAGGVGGIGGWTVCVRNSYVTGSVTGYDSVGGIAGKGACLTGCYTIADVAGYSRTGGLVGDIQTMYVSTPEEASSICTIQNCLMGGYRMEREKEESDSGIYYPKEDRYNGYIYGFPGMGIDDRATGPFYYREGLEAEGFGKGMYEFSEWNCEPYDCIHLEETDFKDLLARPEEKWADEWYCAADYAWPNLAWERDSRFGYTVTVTVQEGDSLWELADAVYGDGHFWTQIYEENKECIGADANLILPGTDLEITVNASQADYAAEGAVKKQEKDFLAKGREQGIANAELKSFYRRLLADDLWESAEFWGFNRQIIDWVIADLDGNGQRDMLLVAGEGGALCPGEIWLYFNGEPVHILKDEKDYYENNFYFGFSFWEDPWMADVDNDGNPELLFAVGNGGNGGPGGRNTCLFRRAGDKWVECLEELPMDYGKWEEIEAGLWVQVTCIGADRYEAYCPYLDEHIEFDGKNSREIGEDEFGRVVGSNVRDFYDFKCVKYKGKNALQCREYLCGEGGNVHCVGNAVFLLAWDADGVCRVADWWVEGEWW